MRLPKNRSLLADLFCIAVTLAVSLLLISLCLLLLSDKPAEAIGFFFAGPVLSRYHLGNWLNGAVSLIFAGLGVSIAMQGQLFNLGGEGQIYSGGLVAYLIYAALSPLSPVLGVLTVLLGSVVVGGIIAGVSGLLRMKWFTDELISSYLISITVILVINRLITGPMRDPSTNLLATRQLDSGWWLPNILPPSHLNLSLLIALFAVGIVQFYLYSTHQGYKLRMCGFNREFARYGGVRVSLFLILPMIWSGALHGLAGATLVLGTYGRVIQGFSFGIGWNGISVALIARKNPIAVVPAAILLAYLKSGAEIAMINANISLEISVLAEAIVLLLITSQWMRELFLARGRRIR